MGDSAPAGKPRRPTITDVAKLAGVSIKTVSRVMNGVATVDPELADRVRVAVAELGYRPNYLASKLKSGESTQTIAMIAKNLSSEFTVAAVSGVETVAKRHTAHLITASTAESDSSEEDLALAAGLAQRRIDGLIVMPTGGDYRALQREIDAGIPVVFIDREPEGITGDIVAFDNAGGSRAAISALIAEGHERIALLFSTMAITTMRERRRGCGDALREAGFLLSQAPAVIGLMDRAAAARAVAHLLDAANPPTAIFCANAEIMVGAATEVMSRGAEVAVAGFGKSGFADLLPLPLTVVEADGFELGRAAATLLYKRIQRRQRPGPDPQRVILPVRLRRTEAVSRGTRR
ncbi:LacI family DNA-binding transcriptional regulator [Leucobacter sp. CSA1]|uniref:LacI family DNA-binding transcriptional regulator n=1 Tax=Leucobacter chromiisoli TaxID=2796471 RepID=A0A934UUK5_9MICO|nr:LacI family DNA-binding transcriptional regulator [Leucobacter chromiisoli]MBK0418521.1 LacI family DNA-binding transcriptional regulator [Leucobacter chromiisoli]